MNELELKRIADYLLRKEIERLTVSILTTEASNKEAQGFIDKVNIQLMADTETLNTLQAQLEDVNSQVEEMK